MSDRRMAFVRLQVGGMLLFALFMAVTDAFGIPGFVILSGFLFLGLVGLNPTGLMGKDYRKLIRISFSVFVIELFIIGYTVYPLVRAFVLK